MPTTKPTTVIHNNVVLTASAANTTSASVNLIDGYGAQLDLKLTNGATGPTIAAQIQIQTSPDDVNFYDFGGPLVGKLANNGIFSKSIQIPIGVKYLRTVSGSNTGQDVTIRAEISEVATI